ncbi:DUF3159 domain-containing protein, partial [Actinomyces sp. 217892]
MTGTSQDSTGKHPAGARTGLGAISGERFDAAAAVGGWRGVTESVLPTLVFVVVMALRPTALVAAVAASLALSALATAARLAQRQPLTQALGGAVLALVSAVWAWRSGQASNFYATGLLINTVWLTGCLASLAVRWPLVGVLMELWRASAQQPPEPEDAPGTGTLTGGADGAAPGGAPDGQAAPPGWSAWRTDPGRAADRRRYALGTVVLSAMFALRLVVEVPLYLAGQEAVSALGVARLVLGVPLFAVTLWFVWLLVRP